MHEHGPNSVLEEIGAFFRGPLLRGLRRCGRGEWHQSAGRQPGHCRADRRQPGHPARYRRDAFADSILAHLVEQVIRGCHEDSLFHAPPIVHRVKKREDSNSTPRRSRGSAVRGSGSACVRAIRRASPVQASSCQPRSGTGRDKIHAHGRPLPRRPGCQALRLRKTGAGTAKRRKLAEKPACSPGLEPLA